MQLMVAMTVAQKAAAILLFTGLVAPLIGLGLKRVSNWSSYGAGPFAIADQRPAPVAATTAPVDAAIQAAEVRQMLEAKAERRRARGEPELDVETEAARLLAAAQESVPDAHDEGLRTEVRQLVVARNERRRRAGLEPLDVATETARQLAELGGAG